MQCRAVVFDLDDTLYPERQYVASGMQRVAAWAEERLGYPAGPTFAELWALFESGVRGDTFNRWLAGHGLDAVRWAPAMVGEYRSHTPRIEPFSDVVPLLQKLRGCRPADAIHGAHCGTSNPPAGDSVEAECMRTANREYRLGLVSDGREEVQQKKLAALGLEVYFDAIVFSDALGRDAWKPSPRPFEAALQRLRVAGCQAIYVADNPVKDFRGARLVGMGTVRLRHSEGLYRDVEPATKADRADWEIAQPADLLEVLDRRRM